MQASSPSQLKLLNMMNILSPSKDLIISCVSFHLLYRYVLLCVIMLGSHAVNWEAQLSIEPVSRMGLRSGSGTSKEKFERTKRDDAKVANAASQYLIQLQLGSNTFLTVAAFPHGKHTGKDI